MIFYVNHGEIWYRMCQQKDEVEDTREQILVPKSFRKIVTGVPHDYLFRSHLGVRKNGGLDSNEFFLPWFHEYVTSFCRLYEAARKLYPEDWYHELHSEICH